jgi:hypothetical protein
MGMHTYVQSATYAGRLVGSEAFFLILFLSGRLVGSEAFQERLAKLKHQGYLQV